MAETLGQRIIHLTLDLLRETPDGIRYAEIIKKVQAADPNLKTNTIQGNVWDIDQKLPDQVYKPSKGLFRLGEFRDKDSIQLGEEFIEKPSPKIKEEQFYQAFADWLVHDLEECTKAIPLGGNRFKDKWGTPDVIGKRESKRSDIVQAPIEITSAEIKTNTAELVTAFGQACAYRLFSHRSYLVVPETSPQDELARLDALTQIFGIGLILFDASAPNTPEFTIRSRPQKQEPDLFYVNRYVKIIEADLFS